MGLLSDADNNNETLTCGIFYCRVSANLNGCGSLQTSSWLDSDVLRNRQQKHTAKTLNTKINEKFYNSIYNNRHFVDIV
jgi:hypothetical protein